jgi:hypothetical protein
MRRTLEGPAQQRRHRSGQLHGTIKRKCRKETALAKTNYKYEKRQKQIDKKKKQDEKLKKKQERKKGPPEAGTQLPAEQ